MVLWVTRRGPARMLYRGRADNCEAERFSAVVGLGFGQRVKRGVEAVLAAPVGFVVGFGGHESDQFLEVVCTGQQDSAVGVGAHAKYQSLTVGVEQHQLSSAAAVLSLTMTSSTLLATLSRRRRRS